MQARRGEAGQAAAWLGKAGFTTRLKGDVRDRPTKPTPAELAHANDVLERMYGEPVLPVSRYCNALTQWANAISQEGAGDEEGPRAFADIVAVRPQLELAIRKSNLLLRLIYLGESVRTEKCPTHDGHWSGYGHRFGGPECDCQKLQGGSWQNDLTGWLP